MRLNKETSWENQQQKIRPRMSYNQEMFCRSGCNSPSHDDFRRKGFVPQLHHRPHGNSLGARSAIQLLLQYQRLVLKTSKHHCADRFVTKLEIFCKMRQERKSNSEPREVKSISNLGARHFEGTFFLKRKGAFPKNEEGTSFCLLQHFGGSCPHCPLFPQCPYIPTSLIRRCQNSSFLKWQG